MSGMFNDKIEVRLMKEDKKALIEYAKKKKSSYARIVRDIIYDLLNSIALKK